jgi:predicted membrane protein
VAVVVGIKGHQAVLAVLAALQVVVQAVVQEEPAFQILVVEVAGVVMEPLEAMAHPRLAQPG